jgi:hypothetical protein
MTDKKFIWDKIFLELSLRATRKIHIDYGMWGVGQLSGNLDKRLEKLNHGPGIELALETTVGAAITQEFINSPLTNGLYHNDDYKHYEIDREMTFESTGDKFSGGKSKKRVDIIIDRYKYKDSKPEYFAKPSIIELKRAHKFKPDITNGTAGNRLKNVKSIIKDLDDLVLLNKLHSEKKLKTKLKYYGQVETFFLYSLFWGTTNGKSGSPTKIVDEIKKTHNGREQIKYFPLYWADNIDKPEIKKWFWICLFELNAP